jgi:LysR family transcriptional regulator, low CO2-responsive transcriptional regulator
MTLHQLRIFERVARDLNITGASAALHLSQPTASLQLKLLQEECGVKFLSRSSHGVELTREGRAFLEAIAPILRQLEIVEAGFNANQKARQRKSLLVGGSPSMSVSLLPQMLMAFRKTHPEFRFVLETNDSRKLEHRVLDMRLDIAVVTNPSYSPMIVYEPYRRHKVVAFAPPSCPLVGRVVKLVELAESPLVCLTAGSIYLTELAKLGVQLNPAVQCAAADAVKASVYKGMGVGILHRECIENDIAAGRLKQIRVPELEKLQVHSYIIYDERKPLTPIAQAFLELLREKGTITTSKSNKKSKLDKKSPVFEGEQKLRDQTSLFMRSISRRPSLRPRS